ncbi:MAG TPA: nucleotide sugar dehydrogenase [Patescibacteria group bacterium]
MNVSVIGLGKLGSPLVATLASKGHHVVGVDLKQDLVSKISQGIAPVEETDLAKYLKKYKSDIKATTDTEKGVLETDITFIIVPTPSEENGSFSPVFVEEAALKIGRALKKKDTYHLVLLTSTVMPGTSERIKKLIEIISEKKCGNEFGFCYNPEFIALGSVIKNLLNPDLILIGESDKKAGDLTESFYKTCVDNKPYFARMNFVNAEISKISVNTFVTTKISYANMLSEICEKIEGANVDVVTATLGQDSRIGIKYIKGGGAFGGPCFPRDNVAFIHLAKKIGANSDIAQATHTINQNQTNRIVKLIKQNTNGDKPTVGILGLSYKPYTNVFEESQGFHLLNELSKDNINLTVYDPQIKKSDSKLDDIQVHFCKSAKECISTSDIVVITTNWPEFENLISSFINGKEKTIIDPWRMLKVDKIPKNVKYIPLGIGTKIN